MVWLINSLPNGNVLDWTKVKVFADDKLNDATIINSVFDRIENIVGKGENAGLPAFSPFPTMFSKVFFLRVIKSRDCVLKSQVKQNLCFQMLREQG